MLFSLNFDSIETNLFIFKYDDVFSFVEKILFHLMDRKQHLISEKIENSTLYSCLCTLYKVYSIIRNYEEKNKYDKLNFTHQHYTLF